MPPTLGIIPADDTPSLTAQAAALSSELNLPLDSNADVLLAVTDHHLEARVQRGDEALVAAHPTWIDLTALDTTSGPGRSLRNPLIRAVGIRKGEPHRPAVLDATAGFGEDAWLLAATGCTVTAYEQHPLLFALLRDALRRAAFTQPHTAGLITLHHADSLARLEQIATDATLIADQVIYLDPMFPAKRKTAQRKPMRLARLLAGDHAGDAADDALLGAALRCGARRVVVKRPIHAPPLAAHLAAPVASHAGKALRFDVYVPQPR